MGQNLFEFSPPPDRNEEFVTLHLTTWSYQCLSHNLVLISDVLRYPCCHVTLVSQLHADCKIMQFLTKLNSCS